MYVKCGVLEYAGKVFHGMPRRDMVSWNTIVLGLAGSGKMLFAQSFLDAMPERDVVLWNSLISRYLQNGEYWKSVEVYVKMMGFDIDVVTGSALVDMYGKCKQLDSALKAFRELPEKNWVSWSAVIAGSVQNDRFVKGIELFDEMQKAGVGLFQLLWKSDLGFDEITLSGARRGCAGIKEHLEGLQLQVLVVKCSLRSNKCVANAMLDMYAYGQNENEKETLSFFVSMLRSWMELDEFTFGSVPKVCAEPDNFTYATLENVEPNHATFVSVLRACGHIGHAEKGRSGQVHEALRLIEDMPFEADDVIWRTLHSICKLHGNVKVAEKAASAILQLDPQDSSTYVMLSNIYAEAGMWGEVSKMRKTMRHGRPKKEPVCSWIEVKDEVHAFLVGDKAHPRCKDAYEKLDLLVAEMTRVGYSIGQKSILWLMRRWESRSFLKMSSKLAFSPIKRSRFPSLQNHATKNPQIPLPISQLLPLLGFRIGRRSECQRSGVRAELAAETKES
ncbi:hypothetical protein ACFX1X_045828 [Malus domestica]